MSHMQPLSSSGGHEKGSEEASKGKGRLGFKGSGKGNQKGKGKGRGKGPAPTAKLQFAEQTRARAFADPWKLARESAVAMFLQGLGVDAEPLDLDGAIFFRSKSLVSFSLLLPLKIAKKARHGLPSASQGGLRSVVFFELPMVARMLPSKTPLESAGLLEDDKMPDQAVPLATKLNVRTAQATLVVSTQQETDAAVFDIVEESQRLVAESVKACLEMSKSEDNDIEQTDDMIGPSSSKATQDVPDHLSIPENLHEALTTRMKRQRNLHDCFERLLTRLPFAHEEAMECERRGLLPGIARYCLLRTWKGGLFRGVPIISGTGNLSTIDMHLRTGLLIPARNVEGLICGLQFRTRTDTKTEETDSSYPAVQHADTDFHDGTKHVIPGAGIESNLHNTKESTADEECLERPKKKPPKYVWVSKDKSVKGDTGDLPFFCVCPRWSCREHTIALVEGGLKAYAFAFLARRFPVIGAAGGQWHQCGKPLLHALARLSAREVLLFADAGAVLNRSVLLDYLRSLRLLRLEWGVDVYFVWWDQVEKNSSFDCDDQLLALRGEGRFASAVDNNSKSNTGEGTHPVGYEKPPDDNVKACMLEAAKLTPASFWAKVPHDLQTRLTEDRSSKDLVSALKPLLDQALSSIPLTHRKR